MEYSEEEISAEMNDNDCNSDFKRCLKCDLNPEDTSSIVYGLDWSEKESKSKEMKDTETQDSTKYKYWTSLAVGEGELMVTRLVNGKWVYKVVKEKDVRSAGHPCTPCPLDRQGNCIVSESTVDRDCGEQLEVELVKTTPKEIGLLSMEYCMNLLHAVNLE